MKKSSIYFLLIAVSIALFSCGKKAADKNTRKPPASKEVVLYNWKEYTSLDTLKEFEKESGIKVILKEFETQDEQLANLQSNPNFCDLTVFDVYMADQQFMPMKIIKKLDPAKLENTKDYASHFKEFISTGAPYSFGITGYAIDTRQVKGDLSTYDFLLDPRYKGKISLLDDSVDVYLDLVLASGNDINREVTEKSSKEVETFVLKLKQNDISFNETFTNLDLLVEGKKWIVQTYNGDAASYMEEHDFIKFVFPKKHFNAWSEMLCLTTNAPNEENAYKLINFLTRKKSAAAFSNEFFYANGILGAEEYMNEKVRNNPVVNVPEEIRNAGRFYLKSKESNSETQRIYTLLNSKKVPDTE